MPGVESLWISAADGSRVESWLLPAPSASPQRPAPLVVFFHGNGELTPNSQYVDLPGHHNDFPGDRPAYIAAIYTFLRTHHIVD